MWALGLWKAFQETHVNLVTQDSRRGEANEKSRGTLYKWFDITSSQKQLDTEPVIYLQQDKKQETRFIYKEL